VRTHAEIGKAFVGYRIEPLGLEIGHIVVAPLVTL
jgi:hypothetical protein